MLDIAIKGKLVQIVHYIAQIIKHCIAPHNYLLELKVSISSKVLLNSYLILYITQ